MARSDSLLPDFALKLYSSNLNGKLFTSIKLINNFFENEKFDILLLQEIKLFEDFKISRIKQLEMNFTCHFNLLSLDKAKEISKMRDIDSIKNSKNISDIKKIEMIKTIEQKKMNTKHVNPFGGTAILI